MIIVVKYQYLVLFRTKYVPKVFEEYAYVCQTKDCSQNSHSGRSRVGKIGQFKIQSLCDPAALVKEGRLFCVEKMPTRLMNQYNVLLG